jgi:hypothetical protein
VDRIVALTARVEVFLMCTTLLGGGGWAWGDSIAGLSIGVVGESGEWLTPVGETRGGDLIVLIHRGHQIARVIKAVIPGILPVPW